MQTNIPPPDRDPTKKSVPRLSASQQYEGKTKYEINAGVTLPIIAGYKLQKKLGEGGMGVVYLAVQEGLKRQVALKVLPRADSLDPRVVSRFLIEAQLLASVKHPNVVEVYDFDAARGTPYIAMELLTGGSLTDVLKKTPRLAPQAAAKLVEKISRGVEAAHEVGIVHRDLKPANVLFNAAGEAKVTDFGLAKHAESDLTRTNAVMGTPHYMPPEQAGGKGKFVGPPADVWALGVILFECLTGQHPFEDETAASILIKIVMQEPSRPRSFDKSIPADLESIILKCLAKDPGDRYPSAIALADDLKRFRTNQPIEARRAGSIERVLKWARRKPTVAATYALTTLAVVLLAFTLFAVRLMWRADHERGIAERLRGDEAVARQQAEDARKDALSAKELAEQLRRTEEQQRKKAEVAEAAANVAKEAAAKFGERVAYARNVSLAHTDARRGDFARANSLLAACPPELRGWEWQYLHRLGQRSELTLGGPAHQVEAAAFSHDGRRIATAGKDSSIRVWDADTGRELFTIPVKDATFTQLAFDPKGQRLLGINFNGAVVFDAMTGVVMRRLFHANCSSGVFNPDGSRVAVVGSGVAVFDVNSGQTIRSFFGAEQKAWFAIYSPDGKRLLVDDRNIGATVLNADDNTPITSLKSPNVPLRTAAYSPDGTRIVTTGEDGAITVWDAKNGATVRKIALPPMEGRNAAFNRDSTQIVVSGERTAKVFSLESGQVVQSLAGHTDVVRTAAFAPDGPRVLTVSKDQTARVWDIGRPPGDISFRATRYAFDCADLAADGTRLVYRFDDKNASPDRAFGTRATVHDLVFGRPLATFAEHTAAIQGLAFTPDGTAVLSGSSDGTLRIWDATTGAERLKSNDFRAGVEFARFSPDGKRMLANSGMAVTVRDAESANVILRLPGVMRHVDYSADGKKLLAIDNKNQAIRVYDSESAQQTFASPGIVNSAIISPDGAYLAAIGFEVMQPGEVRGEGWFNTATIWDVNTNKMTVIVPTGVVSVAFNGDGTRLAVTHQDKTATIWDTRTAKRLQTLHGHTEPVLAAVFHPDSSRVVTGSADGTVKVWDAETGVELITLNLPLGSPVPDVRGELITAAKWKTISGVSILKFSANGRVLFAATQDGRAAVYDSSDVTRVPPKNGGPK